MAKTRTTKCCYHSRYTESYVTPAQYITELICEKHAQIELGDLPRKFWELSKWKNKYKYQIKYANQLVKQYNHGSIVKALLDPRTKNIYSLAHPLLVKIIKEYESKKQDTVVDEKRFVEPSGNYKPVEYKLKQNILGKLRDIDNAV